MRLHNASLAILVALGFCTLAQASPVTFTTTGTLQVVSGADLLHLGGTTVTVTNTLDTTQAPIGGTNNQYSTTITVVTQALGTLTAPATVTINFVGANSSSNNISVSATTTTLNLSVTSKIFVPSIPGTAPAPIASTSLNSSDQLTVSNGTDQTIYSFSSGTISSSPAGCPVTPSTTSLTFSATGGMQSVGVQASSCTWTVSDDSSWLSESPTSGTGNGSVNVTATSNTLSSSRIGHVTIGSTSITVTQTGTSSCTFTFSPTSLTFDSAGATTPLTITPNSSSCTWTATSNQSWLTVSPGSGTGTMTVSVTAASNSSTSSRTATITVGGQTVSVTQNGVNPCTFTVDPTTIPFPSAGSAVNITVTASAGSCAWTASSGVSWVTLNPTSGTGSGSTTATAASNSTGVTPRNGTLTVAGQTVSVTQDAGVVCTFSLSPNPLSISGAGGSGTTTITPSNQACTWTASSTTSWLSLTPPSGTGTATVTVVAQANPTGLPRTGTATIGGQTLTINQDNQAGCTFTFAPSSLAADVNGTSGGSNQQAVTVTPSNSVCQWGVEVPSWITANTYSATGTGPVTFTFAANSTGAARTGTITIGSQTLPVTQGFTAQQFDDVPPSAYYFDAVDLLKTKNVTSGCGPTTYCPADSITRAQMAIFIVRALYGGDDFTYSSTPYFKDVDSGDFGFQWIQKLKELNITSGCGTNTDGDAIFCPDDSVTRDQMAVFIIRARYGASANPTYPTTPYFTDVPNDYWAFSSIQRLRYDSITSGCSVSMYCPTSTVTRGDMAIFVMRGLFNQLLPLYTPVLTTVSPNVISQGQTVNVTITGENTSFAAGASMLASIPGISFGTVTVNSPTSLSVDFTADQSAPQQVDAVRVITGTEEAVLPNGLVVQ